jgi:hypothetical protein
MDSRDGLLLAGLLALGGCPSPPPAAPGWRSFQFAAGPQGLDEDSWAPLDARTTGSLTWGLRQPEWPCGIEYGVQYARAESRDSSVSAGADFLDFRLGAATELRPNGWLLLAGGIGPRLALVEASVPGTFMPGSEEGVSFGIYAHAGAFVRVHGGFAIGLDAQWADGSDYDVLGAHRDAGTAELLLALRWDF